MLVQTPIRSIMVMSLEASSLRIYSFPVLSLSFSCSPFPTMIQPGLGWRREV